MIEDNYWVRFKEYRLFAGVYVSDEVVILEEKEREEEEEKFIYLGRVKMYSTTLPIADEETFGTLGFAKESFGQSLPELLVKSGDIDLTIATFSQSQLFSIPYILLGDYYESNCVDWNFQPSALSHAWSVTGSSYGVGDIDVEKTYRVSPLILRILYTPIF